MCACVWVLLVVYALSQECVASRIYAANSHFLSRQERARITVEMPHFQSAAGGAGEREREKEREREEARWGGGGGRERGRGRERERSEREEKRVSDRVSERE